MNQSRDQERAAFAWGRVQESKDKDAFEKIVVGAPALIMANGLMQSLAFHQGKGHHELVDAICKWLAEQGTTLWPKAPPSSSFSDVMKGLQELPSDQFMQATEETLEMLKWLRQFAKALKK